MPPGKPPPVVTPRTQGPFAHGPSVVDDHVPPFAAYPWEPFSRAAAVAVAQREWRLFGQPIDDDPPDTRPVPPPELKPEREDGLWQRIGEYWWTGQDPDEREVSWTGKHDEFGQEFDAGIDGHYAWSAAFISYIMRIAGAGADFPYSPNHSTYINAAARGTSRVLRAYAPQSYAPLPGDLICLGRGQSAALTFADLPTSDLFPAHCDIVVTASGTELSVIGGNVDDAVTLKHIPLGPNGLLVGADGRIVDQRYGWMVVLKVFYAQDGGLARAPAPTAPAVVPPPASVGPAAVQAPPPAGPAPISATPPVGGQAPAPASVQGPGQPAAPATPQPGAQIQSPAPAAPVPVTPAPVTSAPASGAPAIGAPAIGATGDHPPSTP